MADWILRKFKDSDFEHFLEWRKVVARRDKTQEYIDWEYKNGPWGPAETWVADDDGKIVGQYSTQRYEAFYFGEKMIASLSFDTGSHPKYFHPKKNIFQELGKKFFEEEVKQKIQFSTGFPNEHFLFGGLRLGWKIVCPIPLLETNYVSKINIKKSPKIEIREIQEFDNDFKGFSENFKDILPIFLNRTQKFLNWRYVNKPSLKDPRHHYNYQKYKVLDKTGEMLSYFVTKYYPSEQGRILHLIDFLIPDDNEIYQSIMNFIVEKSKIENINTISLFINQYHPFKNYLHKIGFKYIKTKRKYIVRNNTNILDDKDLLDEKNHYITMGDHDVF